MEDILQNLGKVCKMNFITEDAMKNGNKYDKLNALSLEKSHTIQNCRKNQVILLL